MRSVPGGNDLFQCIKGRRGNPYGIQAGKQGMGVLYEGPNLCLMTVQMESLAVRAIGEPGLFVDDMVDSGRVLTPLSYRPFCISFHHALISSR
jgi:hypothetical protein